MKRNIILLVFSLIGLLVVMAVVSCDSCSKKEKAYSLSLEGNNLYITMPHPTFGIVQLGKADWRGVSLSEVVEDVYQTILDSSITGECNLFVRFIIEDTDKYGNKTETFEEHQLLSLPVDEVRKYQSSMYLDANYQIRDIISAKAFEVDSIGYAPPGWESPRIKIVHGFDEYYDSLDIE